MYVHLEISIGQCTFEGHAKEPENTGTSPSQGRLRMTYHTKCYFSESFMPTHL